MPENHLYYASSPYHHLLALSLAAEKPDKIRSHLVSSPSFTHSDSFIDSLQNWDESPIATVQLYESPLRYSQPQYTLLQTAQSIKSRKIAKSLNPSRVYVAKDTEAAPQALLHYSSEATKFGIEDGTGAYSLNVSKQTPKWKYYARKVFYGYWYDRPSVLGGSKFLDGFAASFPNELRPELNELVTEQISPDFLQEMDTNWLQPFFDNCGLVSSKHEGIDTLVIAAHSSVAESDPEYRQRLTTEIKARTHGGATVGVKYHPRDRNVGYLDLDAFDAVTVPRSVPAEILYLLATDLTTVIGSMSTALMSARWLDKDLSVISMAETTGVGDEHMIETMRSIGIEVR